MATTSVNNLAHAIYDSSKDKSGTELDRVMQNTVNLLVEKHMLGKAPQIMNKLEGIIDSHDGIVRAKVSSKVKLSKKMTEEVEGIVKKRYKAKDVLLTLEENKELLGGIKIEVGDEVINMTLKNRLEKLQNHLNTN